MFIKKWGSRECNFIQKYQNPGLRWWHSQPWETTKKKEKEEQEQEQKQEQQEQQGGESVVFF